MGSLFRRVHVEFWCMPLPFVCRAFGIALIYVRKVFRYHINYITSSIFYKRFPNQERLWLPTPHTDVRRPTPDAPRRHHHDEDGSLFLRKKQCHKEAPLLLHHLCFIILDFIPKMDGRFVTTSMNGCDNFHFHFYFYISAIPTL